MSWQIRTFDNGEACFEDRHADNVFGPLMGSYEEADAFRLYLEDNTTFKTDYKGGLHVSSDPRDYPPYLLRHHYDEFMRMRNEAKVEDAARALLVEMGKQ